MPRSMGSARTKVPRHDHLQRNLHRHELRLRAASNFHLAEFDRYAPSGLKIHESEEDGGLYFMLEHNAVALPLAYMEVYMHEDAISSAYCADIIDEAEQYSRREGGWTKARHKAFPTTDIPLEAVFGKYSHIHAMVDCHILPQIAKNFDLNEEMLQIGEIFICKYEFTPPTAGDAVDEERDTATFGSGDSVSMTQTGLGAHKDGTPWSFVLSLNDPASAFEGGGTHFVAADKTFRGSRGGAVLFSGKNEHRGVPITSGLRYIMTGFINYVDKKDKSHKRFMEDFDIDRDGAGAVCRTSEGVVVADLQKDGCGHIELDHNNGIHTGDRLHGLVDSDGRVRLLEGLGSQDVRDFMSGSKGTIKVLIERDDDSDERQRVIQDCHRLLSTQNYWCIDSLLAWA